MKTLITILGPGASGKTTLGLALGGKGGVEHMFEGNFARPPKFVSYPNGVVVVGNQVRGEDAIEEPELRAKIVYTLFDNGVSLVGNKKTGEDFSGENATLIRATTTTTLLALKQAKYIVRNGVMVSKLWNVDWVNTLPQKFASLFVYFDISPEENERRLLQRRRNNGHVETKLPEKTYQNMLSFRGRHKGVFLAAQQFYRKEPVDFLILEEGWAPEACAKKVWKAVKKLCA